MPISMKAQKPDLVDMKLRSFSPEEKENFRQSVHHNRQVLKRLAIR
jgi:hypothetical protein